MITADVTLHVYSTVTGRTGNWSWRTRMRFEAIPVVGSWIIWGTPAHELTNRVRLVYYYSEAARGETGPAVAIDLDWLQTDSPDILNEAFELHRGWEQSGSPWAGQEER